MLPTMKSAVRKGLLIAFIGVFAAGVHGMEILSAAHAERAPDDCRCGSDCSCRSPESGCKRCHAGLSMKARCGCCGSGPHRDGIHHSRDTVLVSACHMGAPLPIWSPAPDPDDHRVWQPPSEHEHPPRPLQTLLANLQC